MFIKRPHVILWKMGETLFSPSLGIHNLITMYSLHYSFLAEHMTHGLVMWNKIIVLYKYSVFK
jgi:hypothetical protein